MRVEIPILKKCCCCLPLRRGLLFWIYLKLALGMLLLIFIIYTLIKLTPTSSVQYRYIVITISMLVLLMDIAFNSLFLISAHRKSHQYMRIYYRYMIGMLIIEVVAILIIAGLDLYRALTLSDTMFVWKYMESLCIVSVHIVLQAYLAILVRSELLKLERSTKLEFINHNNEPECKAQLIL